MTRRVSLGALLVLAACGGNPQGPPVRFTIPPAAGLSAAADTLSARGIVRSEGAFRLYARLRRADRRIQPGVYEIRRGTGWDEILGKLTRGDVVTTRLTIPEGWTVRQIAPRLAQAAAVPPESAMARIADSAAPVRYGVPGPTLEGYLYPATYEFPLGTPLDRVLRTLTARYRQVWTPARRQRAAALGMSEREIVTLASIVEAEARVWEERPTIAAVYHNRLRARMRLQADPTVQYALGENRQARLLYRDIAAVGGDPYNTYRNAGLPPGPIGNPSEGAIDAALNPAPVDFLFFVARPDGRHVFTRTLAQHNAAKRAVQAARRADARR